MDTELIVKEILLKKKLAELTLMECDECHGKGSFEWHSQGWSAQCPKCHGLGKYIINDEKWYELVRLIK